MNTTNVLRKLLLAVLCSVLFQGCLEHTITTTVRPDGSCIRVIKVVADKDSILKFSFPLRRDGSWRLETRREEPQGKKGAKYITTATKEFNSIDALAKEYAADDSTGKVRVRIAGERRFRWFYTYTRYTETYDVSFPYARIPLASYMSDEEVRRYQNGENNDTLKSKADAWYERCQFEYVFTSLAAEVKALRDPVLTPEYFESQKENIARLFGNKEEQKKIKTAADVVVMLKQLLYTSAVEKLTEAIDRAMQSVTEKEERSAAVGDSYTNTVHMPGLILESTAPEIVGARVTWHTDFERLRLRPFEMSVESRVVNVWAFVSTGVVILLLIVLIVWIGVRRFRLR
jgi:hypothetical protein